MTYGHCVDSYGVAWSLLAHTKESAAALATTIEMAFPKSRLVLVVAMANDKDHIGFARELLSGLIAFWNGEILESCDR